MLEMFVYAAVTFALAHLVFGVVLWLRVRRFYSYPGLLGSPVFGNLYYFYKTMLLFTSDSLHKYVIKVTEEYGKNGLHFQWLYGTVTAIVSSPHLIKKLLYHPNLADKSHAMYGAFSTNFDGPFSCLRSDDEWKLKKNEYNTFLKKSHVDNDYYDTFVQASDKLVNMILESPSDMEVHVSTFTEEAAGKALIGFETDLLNDPEVKRMISKMKVVGSYFGSNPYAGRALAPLIQPIDHLFLGKAVQLRKVALESIDNALLSNKHPLPGLAQMALRHKKYNGSEKSLLKEAQELFFTGGQTIASTFANSLIFLALLPDIQERVWQEQNEIFGDDNRDPTLDDLKEMDYLDRFIKESLRFLGPMASGRVASGEIEIDGITIPSGTVVIYLTSEMRKDLKYWKNPDVFDPDRFIEQNDLLKYVYTPFGLGIRNCPGMYYSTTLMKIGYSKLLRRLKFKTVEKDFQFEDIKYRTYIFQEVDNPPTLLVEERL